MKIIFELSLSGPFVYLVERQFTHLPLDISFVNVESSERSDLAAVVYISYRIFDVHESKKKKVEIMMVHNLIIIMNIYIYIGEGDVRCVKDGDDMSMMLIATLTIMINGQ